MMLFDYFLKKPDQENAVLRILNILNNCYILTIFALGRFSWIWIRILSRFGSGLEKNSPRRILTEGLGSETLDLRHRKVNTGQVQLPRTATGAAVARHQTRMILSVLPAARRRLSSETAISVISALAPRNVKQSRPLQAPHICTQHHKNKTLQLQSDYSSVAEPVEKKLQETWCRSRNYLLNKYLLQSSWNILG